MQLNTVLAGLGITLFLLILYSVGPGHILNIFLSFDVYYLLFLLPVVAFNMLLKSFKWKLLLDAAGQKAGFIRCLRLSFIAIFVGVITPAKIGEFIKVIYLKQDGWDAGPAFTSVLIDRLMDVFVMMAIALPSVLVFTGVAGDFGFFYVIIGLAIIVILSLYMLSDRSITKKVLCMFVGVLVPATYKKRLKGFFSSTYKTLIILKRKQAVLCATFFLTILVWLFFTLECYIITLGINLQIPFVQLFFLIPLISIVELLPISIHGMGTRELFLVYILAPFSVTTEGAVAFSLLYIIFSYWLVALVGLVLWLKNPIKLDFLKDKGI